jgi:hypothetical protein
MKRVLLGSIVLNAVAVLGLTTAGCNVEKVAQLADQYDSGRPSGPNTAIGGVNYLQQGSGKDRNWDRHITACRLDPSGALILGTDHTNAMLTLVPVGDSAYALLNGPSGPVRFARKDCSIFKVTLSPPSDGAQTGSETLVCAKDSATLSTTVRFNRCSH